MLCDNIKLYRKVKGLSQEELATKLNVVRQTVSKWEKGLSVPDADLLILLSEALDVPVSALLGEAPEQEESTQLQVLAAKLEILNEQFARQAAQRRKTWRIVFILLGCVAVLMLLLSAIDFASWQILQHKISDSTSIIGGADGPTGILVASAPFRGWAWIPAICIGAVSLIGICGTRKK